MKNPDRWTTLHEVRTRRGWTQLQLAVRAGVALGTLQRVENATDVECVQEMPLCSLLLIAEACEVSLAELLPNVPGIV